MEKKTKYTIRKALPSDASKLNELLTKLIQDEKKYDKNINENCIVTHLYEDLISNEYNSIFVALENNQIIGYIFGYIVDNGDAYLDLVAKLEALYVEENYRNRGIGNDLIIEFKKWATMNKVKYIEVSVCSKNENAIKLYNKHGFIANKYILNVELKGEEL